MQENEPAEGTEPKPGQAIRWLIAVTEHIDVTERLERLEAPRGPRSAATTAAATTTGRGPNPRTEPRSGRPVPTHR